MTVTSEQHAFAIRYLLCGYICQLWGLIGETDNADDKRRRDAYDYLRQQCDDDHVCVTNAINQARKDIKSMIKGVKP